MCRNIKTLFNFDPPATDEEVQAASLRFVRKLSGFTKPSKANETAFEFAIEQVVGAACTICDSMVTGADSRDREVEEKKARARAEQRFGPRTRCFRWGTRRGSSPDSRRNSRAL